MSRKHYDLTEEGVLQLQEELTHLKDVKRPENLKNLGEARAQGDLTENADYDAARSEQAKIESRIKEIEIILKNVRIIVPTNDNTANIGKKVKLLFINQKVEREFVIIGTVEANPSAGKISLDSPIGRAIRGHQVGDVVTVKSETGNIFNVKILEIGNIESNNK